MPHWSHDDVLAEMRRWADLYGGPPKSSDWVAPRWRWPSTWTVRARFGLWNTAVRAAGFEPYARGRPQRWTREAIIACLRRFDESGTRPTYEAWRKGGDSRRPRARVVEQRFGTWGAGLREAGIEPGRPGRRRAA
jgi:hypothetical protein